jgi:CRP-like cAMP-binding protein
MLQQLKHLEPFRDLDLPALQTVARHATLIDLPAGRPMQPPGKTLTGRYYLLRGKLKVRYVPSAITPSPEPIFPQFADIMTLTSAQLLHVDVDRIAFLFDAVLVPVEPASLSSDCWQSRFLQSHMLAALSPRHWQEILRSLTAQSHRAEDWILRSGQRADRCFILASGAAVVTRSGNILRRLSPGDFFGEDALLSGECRNAGVQMCSAGVAMAMDQVVFHRWLADFLVAGEGLVATHGNQRRRLLPVLPGEDLRERLKAADPCSHYQVSGPDRIARLAVFLLRQKGIRATLI